MPSPARTDADAANQSSRDFVAPKWWNRPATITVIAAIVFGLAARAICIAVAPQNAYLRDHVSNMGWGTYGVEHGPWNMYDMPANQPLIVLKRDPRAGGPRNRIDLNPHALNYPPLGAYLFWIQGLLWHALERETATLHPPPPMMREYNLAGPVTSRVIDTHVSRFCDALPGIVFDFFLAWGAAALARALRGGRRNSILEAIAFSIVMLAPPIFLDSAFWNQADSWIACWLVWCLVFLMRGRLIAAGAIFGLALMTKPQAVLFGPVLLYIFFSLRYRAGGSWRQALELWKPAATAALVALFIAAPFMIADGLDERNPEGAWRWFKRSYVGTIGADQYSRTTLNAFNLWWLDMLAQGSLPDTPAQQREFFRRLLSTDETWLGVRKAVVGKLLLAAGALIAGVLCARRWRWEPPSWPVCAYLVTLAAFTLPTSVHERYIYYCLPFLIALVVHELKWIPPLLALLLVGTFEMTSYDWAGPQNLYGDGGFTRIFSGLLAALTVCSLLYSYAVITPRLTGHSSCNASANLDR